MSPKVKDRFRSRTEQIVEAVRKRKTRFIAAALLIIVTIALTVSGPPEQEKVDVVSAPSNAGSIAVPIDVPEYMPDAVALDNSRSNIRKNTLLRLNGPKVVSRPINFKMIPGATGQAKLLTAASNGPIKAVLLEDVAAYGETILNAGAILLGSASSRDDRALLSFSKVVFEDGSQSDVSAEALDPIDKVLGIRGSTAARNSLRLAGGLGLNFISGVADGLQEKEVHGGTTINKATLRNALLNGTSKTAFDESRDVLSNLKNQPPNIKVKDGTVILLMFGKAGNE